MIINRWEVTQNPVLQEIPFFAAATTIRIEQHRWNRHVAGLEQLCCEKSGNKQKWRFRLLLFVVTLAGSGSQAGLAEPYLKVVVGAFGLRWGVGDLVRGFSVLGALTQHAGQVV
jgi:hypothetical protein